MYCLIRNCLQIALSLSVAIPKTDSCDILPIKNGAMYSLIDGNSAVITCDTGYKLKGAHFVRCTGGEWIPSLPTCEKLD